jgi:Leucine-rich repeat (LRR) protein
METGKVNYTTILSNYCNHSREEEYIVGFRQLLNDESTVWELVKSWDNREQLVNIRERIKQDFPVEGQETVNRINQVIYECYFETNILGEILNHCASLPSKLNSLNTLLTDASRVCKTWRNAAYLCARKRMIEKPFLYRCNHWHGKKADTVIKFAEKHQILGLDLTEYDLEDHHLEALNKKVTNLCCLAITQPDVSNGPVKRRSKAIPQEKRAKVITEWPAMLSLKTLILRGYPSAKICGDLATRCTNLQIMNLARSNINNEGIKELAKCSNLEEINLDEVNVSAIAPFANSLKLRVINLKGTSVTDKDLAVLANSVSLQVIILTNTNVGNDGVSSLGKCKSLRKLIVDCTKINDETFSSLAKSTSLEELDISDTYVTDIGLAALARCLSLRKLRLCDASCKPKISAKGIWALAPSNLQFVIFNQLYLDPEGFIGLSKILTIQEIDLTSTDVDDETLFGLAKCNTLQGLKLRNSRKFPTEDGISALAKNESLRQLSYHGENFTDKVAEAFAHCKSLEGLHVCQSDVTDIGIGALAKSKTLCELTLDSSKVTDSGVFQLTDCENLFRLSLTGTKVSKEGVLALTRNKKNLFELHIRGAKFDYTEINEVIETLTNERPHLNITIRNSY